VCAPRRRDTRRTGALPTTLREVADLFEHSDVARAAFVDEVVAHYLHQARTEVGAFDAAITDWERTRGFERFCCPPRGGHDHPPEAGAPGRV